MRKKAEKEEEEEEKEEEEEVFHIHLVSWSPPLWGAPESPQFLGILSQFLE